MKAQITQASQGLGLGYEGGPPEGGYCLLDISFERLFQGWGGQGMDRVREGVLLAEVSNLGKPGILDTVVEDINTMLVEDIRGS